jgi:hypothetical protein
MEETELRLNGEVVVFMDVVCMANSKPLSLFGYVSLLRWDRRLTQSEALDAFMRAPETAWL